MGGARKKPYTVADQRRDERATWAKGPGAIMAALEQVVQDGATSDETSVICAALHVLISAAGPEAPETCVCAAIQAVDGRIFRGHRHDDALATAGKAGTKGSSLAAAQGFMTTRNNYVDRREGMRLQKAAGLKSAHHGGPLRGDLLFSEDLY